MTVEAEALAVARAYADAESRILARIAAALAASLDAPDFERVALARLQRLRAEAVAELVQLSPVIAAQITDALAAEYAAAGAGMLADIADEVPGVLAAATQVRAGTSALARELTEAVGSVAGPVLRNVDDAFRSIVGSVVQASLARGVSRRKAAQEALDRAFARGLQFRDAGGRLWRLPDYAEMATRTGLAKATIAGHEAALDKAGLDLVMVQPGPRACKVCDKWAHKVLSRSGVTGSYSARNELTGGTIVVHVDDTLAAARAAGFQHPNCRCRLRAFIPGVMKAPDSRAPQIERMTVPASSAKPGDLVEQGSGFYLEVQRVDVSSTGKNVRLSGTQRHRGTSSDPRIGQHEYIDKRPTSKLNVTRETKPQIVRPPWDEDGYNAQQKQRAIERDIRQAKLVQSLALDEQRAQLAAAAVKQQQARMRAHIAEHPELKRRSEREQITGRFATPAERARAVRR